jgi:hypothetical protein
MKYSFMSDDDGHLFIVPIEKKKEFRELMNKSYEEDDFIEFENKFKDMRATYGISRYCFENVELDM